MKLAPLRTLADDLPGSQLQHELLHAPFFGSYDFRTRKESWWHVYTAERVTAHTHSAQNKLTLSLDPAPHQELATAEFV